MLSKIRYICQSLQVNVNKVQKKYGGFRIAIFVDMIFSMIRYSASPSNYYYFGFVRLNHDQRKTYVTHKISEQIQKKYNSDKYQIVFYDKMIFSRVFSDFFGRKCISTQTMKHDDFIAFTNNFSKFIYKPLEGGQGKGIQVFEKKDVSYAKAYDELKGSCGIIEEWIQQHSKMQELYPDAVNIIRVQTIFADNKCHLLGATLTIGHKSRIANASADSIFALVDVKSGRVSTDGCDYNDNTYIFHPETGIHFKGFLIPMWNEVIEMLEKAAARVPEIGYVGWDIAVTETGPVLIEGNNDGGYIAYQLFELSNGHGMKDLYQKFL